MRKIVFGLFSALGLALPAAAQDPVLPVAEEQIARGLLMQHDGKMIFAPCRDRSYANVEDVSPGAAVTVALGELGLADGKNLYVEFLGKSEGGNLRVSAVNFARTETRCQQPGGTEESWRAAGNGPAWSLAVGAGQLLLKRAGKPDLQLAHGEIRSEGTTTQIPTAEKATAEWRFYRQICRDKGASMLFGWQAELKVDGEVLKGCAWQR